MDKSKIGQFLKFLRMRKGKKQFQVAMDLFDYGIEVSDKTIAKWEKGNFPDMDKLNIIAEYYGVQVSDILNGEIYTPQNFEEKYFIVNSKWFERFSADELYKTRIEQERTIKARVKELLLELIDKKSLTVMQNDELNFLFDNFYSISDYAKQSYGELENYANNQTKLLRHVVYREILSMHGSSLDEIYWEVKKLFDYDKRIEFERDLCGFEENIPMTEKLLQELEDWEKDLLLAQIQTHNITDFYDKLTYLKKYGIDYDEERITKEGIKLLIKSGAKLNSSLLGFEVYRYEPISILDEMEKLHYLLDAKILLSSYNSEKNRLEFYWAENSTKNRLIDLYYFLNCTRKDCKKLSLDELYEIFIKNEKIPENILIERYQEYMKPNMSRKEQLLLAERIGVGDIKSWQKCKDAEKKVAAQRRELQRLEQLWNAGEQLEELEYTEWIGEKKNVLTENDILSRMSIMSYAEYKASRNSDLTAKLLEEIDTLSLEEIRKKYFPVEKRYEEL
ncbi:MAG: hypothetical protein J1G02_05690 [Clostridiales bacterium]|nr:hypothetical protein [Clostridiales bacterium]